MNSTFVTGSDAPAGSLMTYRDGERASSDIGTLNVTIIVFELVDDTATSRAWLPTPWSTSWTVGTGEPETSVRAPVVESRYGPSAWPGVVSATTVRWLPTKAVELTARLPTTLPAASSLSIL